MSARALASLVRWLGPWTGPKRVPSSAVREEIVLDPARSFRGYLYRPRHRRALGAYLVAHGLHYEGPDDPRMDRFCRILAASGLMVLAPHLPDHLALRIAPRVADDLGVAFERLETMAKTSALAPPALFSISFGSLPAIMLAGHEAYRERVGALVVFGGYADFASTVRFAITGRAGDGTREVRVPFDPLNTPVVYLALVDAFGLGAEDREAVVAAWRAIVERTWGRLEMKVAGARDPIAAELAAALRGEAREVFLEGCGLRPVNLSRIEAALDSVREAFAFADPSPHLARLRAPVAIVHGRDDDVIPYLEAERLRALLPPDLPHRVLLTGMVDHSRVTLPSPRALAREVSSMVGVLRAMLDAPTGKLGVARGGARSMAR